MKTVVLIGDSIRMGYQEKVRELLAGSAEVVAPEENGGTSANVLQHLDEWAFSHNADVIHVNCGLHDIARDPDSDDARVPLDTYRQNVRTILSRLKSETNARIVWASTTPVNEAWHHENKPFDRLEKDLLAHNTAASEVCAELDVAIDDLHEAVLVAGPDTVLQNDGVHFKPEGCDLLGETVATFIKRIMEAD